MMVSTINLIPLPTIYNPIIVEVKFPSCSSPAGWVELQRTVSIGLGLTLARGTRIGKGQQVWESEVEKNGGNTFRLARANREKTSRE